MKKRHKYASDVQLGHDVVIANYVNLYGCQIGDYTKIGAFVEIQKNASIGINCKISSHSFICEGVTIKNNCFIGHGVMFINDNRPQSVALNGKLETENDWKDRFVYTLVSDNVSIGSNSTILGGITIGENALIGAGSVVTKSVPPGEIWVGNPARRINS